MLRRPWRNSSSSASSPAVYAKCSTMPLLKPQITAAMPLPLARFISALGGEVPNAASSAAQRGKLDALWPSFKRKQGRVRSLAQCCAAVSDALRAAWGAEQGSWLFRRYFPSYRHAWLAMTFRGVGSLEQCSRAELPGLVHALVAHAAMLEVFFSISHDGGVAADQKRFDRAQWEGAIRQVRAAGETWVLGCPALRNAKKDVLFGRTPNKSRDHHLTEMQNRSFCYFGEFVEAFPPALRMGDAKEDKSLIA